MRDGYPLKLGNLGEVRKIGNSSQNPAFLQTPSFWILYSGPKDTFRLELIAFVTRVLRS